MIFIQMLKTLGVKMMILLMKVPPTLFYYYCNFFMIFTKFIFVCIIVEKMSEMK